MSSPLADRKTRGLGKVLIDLHQAAAHGSRLHVLANCISAAILRHAPKDAPLRCLDVGCGDMRLAELLAAALPHSAWTCMDVYELPMEYAGQERWNKYRRFDGSHFPFADKSFDIVLFADVLHHARDNAATLLTEAARTGRLILVKDHFEYSWWSRGWLLLMDFVGNWGYGVPLPRQYYNRKQFITAVQDHGLRIRDMHVGIELYRHLPVVRSLLRKEWQFLAVLEPETPGNKRAS
jgi:SAM-dependent methyltransferase